EATIDGASFIPDANTLGWGPFSLSFHGDQGTLALTIGGAQAPLEFGLAAVPRITRGGNLAAVARYQGADIALAGHWEGDVFVLEFSTIDRIDAGTIRFTFDSSGVGVDAYEKTFFLTDFAFHAQKQ